MEIFVPCIFHIVKILFAALFPYNGLYFLLIKAHKQARAQARLKPGTVAKNAINKPEHGKPWLGCPGLFAALVIVLIMHKVVCPSKLL